MKRCLRLVRKELDKFMQKPLSDAAAAGEVVNADQEEDLGWLALGDDVESVEHGIGSIAADSSVLDV